ncbi:MAG: GntR family transcriptional regulator [Acidimicrobiales bacterium]|jgi:GntR family transcriptional regulator
MSTIDKRSTVPYYEQLAELLRREIQQNKPPTGLFQLPSENELAALHGVSRPTIRHALDSLERQGYIYREKGRGSFAVTRRVEQELTHLVSTTEAMSQRGWTVASRVVSLNYLKAPASVAHALELGPNDYIYELCRVRTVGDAPLSVQTACLPAHLCPGFEENDLTSSLYRLLDTRYGLRLWSGSEILRARGATQDEARLLEIRKGTPVMSALRVTYTSTGTAVEYLEAVWRGDRYDFKVALARPPD